LAERAAGEIHQRYDAGHWVVAIFQDGKESKVFPGARVIHL